MVGIGGDTAGSGVVVTATELAKQRRSEREHKLEERDEEYGLEGKNENVDFVGVKFPGMVDPKTIKFTRNGDMMLGFIVPARYIDSMLQVRAAMRRPVLIDVQPWTPDGTVS